MDLAFQLWKTIQTRVANGPGRRAVVTSLAALTVAGILAGCSAASATTVATTVAAPTEAATAVATPTTPTPLTRPTEAINPTMTPIATEIPVATIESSPTEAAPAPTVVDTPPPKPTPTGLNTPTAVVDVIQPTSTAVATPQPVVSNQIVPQPVTANQSVGSDRHSPGPIELLIPKIGVRAAVEAVGADRTGAMATPSGPYTVGWWDRGTVPGQPGNAVIDGHLDSARVGAAVFWSLGELGAGDQILLQMPGNKTLTFVVDHTSIYPFNDAPLLTIFGPSSTPSLNLVTCSGSFDRSSHNYNRRLVVYSRLKS